MTDPRVVPRQSILEPCPWAGRAHPANCTCIAKGLFLASQTPTSDEEATSAAS